MEKAPLLRLITDPLEEVLACISQTLTNHEVLVAMMPQLENEQCAFRNELARLRVAFDSILQRINHDGSTPELLHTPNENDEFGVTSGLQNCKSAIRRLKQDRDDGVATSMELDLRISSTKDDLFKTQHKLSSLASKEQLYAVQKSLVAQFNQAEDRLKIYKADFHDEVEGSINTNLLDVKSWFTEGESLAKQRHAKLEQRLAACAREDDFIAFQEDIEVHVSSLVKRSSLLDDFAKATGQSLLALRRKLSIAMIHRHYVSWKINALASCLSRWKQIVKRQRQYKDAKFSQKSLIRKTLTNIVSRRKRCVFVKWIQYRDWHRKMEEQKLNAATIICNQFGKLLIASKIIVFNRWRRLTLLDIRKCADAKGESITAIQIDIADSQMETPLPLDHKKVGAFGSDIQGAMFALTNEIQNIKIQDIPALRQRWYAETEALGSTLCTTLNESIQNVNEAASVFQAFIIERVDSRTNDLPAVQSKLDELSSLFQCSVEALESVDERHAKSIDAIVAQDRQLEQRLEYVEEQVRTAALEMTSVFQEHAKFNESIQLLRESIECNENRHSEERLLFDNALNHFGEELFNTKITLGHTQVLCNTLQNDLTETKSELTHFQEACQAETDKINDSSNQPGIPKPSLDRIVNVGHAYEALAKEKSYVTGINIAAVMKTAATLKMKRREEKVIRTEGVDVTSEIAAFAHDYAKWIAYQVDHDSLLRLIAGSNFEDQIYAEDDNIVRRNDLCSDLKSDLGTLLERSTIFSQYSDVADPVDKTTRGTGIRWEARTIFLSRIGEALNAALSKHEQILLLPTTRMGRVDPTSSITYCVACDRPMRPRTSTPATENKASAQKTKDGSMPSIDDSEPFTPEPVGIDTRKLLPVRNNGEAQSLQRSKSVGKLIKTSHLSAMKKDSKTFFELTPTVFD